MDSANSNSMQSSSGGGGDDQEYDSRAHDQSISAFLNSSSSSIPPPLFDSQPNYFMTSFHHPTTTNNNNPNSPLNFDMLWSSKTLTPHSHHTNTNTINNNNNNNNNLSPSMGPLASHQNPPLHQTPVRPSASSSSDQTRISKKRSRASRRAPTTVLTTDTSNFRSMVQEFTGIPAPPFSARTGRFDLFNTSSRPPPPYLLRPFAQKLQPQPQPYGLASSGSNNNITSLVTTTTSNPMNSTTNYSLLSDQLGLPKQSHQNPTLTFQSLLQSTPPPKYSLLSSPLNTKPQGLSTTDPNSTIGLLQDQFNTNQGNAITHQSEFTNLEEMVARNGGTSWDHEDHQGLHLRSFNENYENSSQQVNSCKIMNSSTSGFNVEKAMENGPSRGGGGGGGGEGMVDSWICSSE